MRLFLRVGVSVLTLFSFSAAQAAGIVAELHLIKGKVLVNAGHGFMSAGAVKAGDKILLGRQSHALLTYPNGCDVPLTGKQIYIVQAEPPCAPEERLAQVEPTMPEPPPPAPYIAPEVVDSGFGTMGIIGAGVLGAAALGGAAFLLLRKPASGG
jgi:hypothetical protein